MQGQAEQDRPTSTPLTTGRLVLYDGACGFCDALVQWLLPRDPAGRFQFAPLAGPTAQALLARHPEVPAGLDSLLYVTGLAAEEQVHWESRAAFLIFSDLGYPWAVLAWPRILPRFITDFGYRIFARLRYRVFGRLDACRVPGPEERARFLP
jgi:predicted DCC family thiol-disulfide oxidoreductase YuxK